jgi:hypothetical protein
MRQVSLRRGEKRWPVLGRSSGGFRNGKPSPLGRVTLGNARGASRRRRRRGRGSGLFDLGRVAFDQSQERFGPAKAG